jgi:hypothetical protein
VVERYGMVTKVEAIARTFPGRLKYPTQGTFIVKDMVLHNVSRNIDRIFNRLPEV